MTDFLAESSLNQRQIQSAVHSAEAGERWGGQGDLGQRVQKRMGEPGRFLFQLRFQSPKRLFFKLLYPFVFWCVHLCLHGYTREPEFETVWETNLNIKVNMKSKMTLFTFLIHIPGVIVHVASIHACYFKEKKNLEKKVITCTASAVIIFG